MEGWRLCRRMGLTVAAEGSQGPGSTVVHVWGHYGGVEALHKADGHCGRLEGGTAGHCWEAQWRARGSAACWLKLLGGLWDAVGGCGTVEGWRKAQGHCGRLGATVGHCLRHNEKLGALKHAD